MQRIFKYGGIQNMIFIPDKGLNMHFDIYTVFQKRDAKIQITITTAHLIRINYPLSSFSYRLSGTKVANFNKIHCIVSEQQIFKKWNLKTEFFPIWKIPISILTAGSVTNNDIMLVTFS